MSARHEYKYALAADQDALLCAKAAALMPRDIHAGPAGSYVVRSLYLDDAFDSCLWDSLSGGEPRAKFRLRYYGSDAGTLRLEKKRKRDGMGRKESCRVTPGECARLLRGEPVLPAPDDAPERLRLLTEINTLGLTPKIIVTYDREAFVYPGGNVRVTFDRALTSSDDLTHFLTGDYPQRPVYAMGACVMEIKWDTLLPRHIKGALQTDGLTWTAFSKYYWCRTLHL